MTGLGGMPDIGKCFQIAWRARVLLGHGTHVGNTASVHAMYLRISSESKARLYVGWARPPKSDMQSVVSAVPIYS